MSLPSTTVWEVRTTGSDSNGGGFNAARSGTDYSQQDAAQFSGTDLVIDGTTTTKVTAAGHTFVAADCGNIIHVTAGTGFTVGFYEVVSVSSGAATLDRAVGTAGSTGGTWALGGALESPGVAWYASVGCNTVWVKQGTYPITTTTLGQPNSVLSGGMRTLEGYGTARGSWDASPLLKVSGLASAYVIDGAAGDHQCYIRNIEIDCGSDTGCTEMTGIRCGGDARSNVMWCKVSNCKTGITTSNAALPHFCAVVNHSGYGIGAWYAYGCVCIGNGLSGSVGFGGPASNCLVVGAYYGYYSGPSEIFVHNCTFIGNTADGMRNDTSWRTHAVNCVSVNNGGYGYKNIYECVNCVACGNTSGASSGITILRNLITPASNPLTSAADPVPYSPDSGASGQLLRATALWAFGVLVNPIDIGAVQHADAGGVIVVEED